MIKVNTEYIFSESGRTLAICWRNVAEAISREVKLRVSNGIHEPVKGAVWYEFERVRRLG